jgi:hypothetical protein
MPGVLVGVVLELTRFVDSLMSSSFELLLLGCRTWHFPQDMCPVILCIYGGALRSTLIGKEEAFEQPRRRVTEYSA